MPTLTYREALNQALAEEMERDERVMLMGEEVRRVRRRLQGQPGPAEKIRPEADHRHADQRDRLLGPGHRRGRCTVCGPWSSS